LNWFQYGFVLFIALLLVASIALNVIRECCGDWSHHICWVLGIVPLSISIALAGLNVIRNHSVCFAMVAEFASRTDGSRSSSHTSS
jgi:hypothetical protein